MLLKINKATTNQEQEKDRQKETNAEIIKLIIEIRANKESRPQDCETVQRHPHY